MIGTLNREDVMRELLTEPGTWAVVGCSPQAASVSYGVAHALWQHGHRVIPVNPSAEGEMFGEPFRRSLSDIDEHVDVVDIFRRADGVADLVDDAIPLHPTAIWLQLGAIDHDAAARATKAGIHVIMDRCPKIEYASFAMRAR
jgi:uncharacterized protein